MPLREMTGRGARVVATIALAVAVMAVGDGGRRAAAVVTGDLATVSGGQAASISIGELGITGNFGTAGVGFSPSMKRLVVGSGAQSINIVATNVTTPALSLSGDGLDNDGDGKIDEDPVTGIDEDGDAKTDEDPVDGLDNDAREGGITGLVMSCFDGIDNDGDGLIDNVEHLFPGDPYPDPDCIAGDALFTGDGLADEDPPPGQRGSDDDKDGREGGPSAAAGTCDDQLDNDHDGLRDMADADCAGRIDEDPVRGKNTDSDAYVDEDPPDDDLVGEGGSKTISGNTAANPTVITTTAAHNLVVGKVITIAGSNSTPVINGTWIVATVPSATTLTLTGGPNVTLAGTTGTITTPMNCVDGVDNDADGYVDRNDPECQGDGRVDEDPIDGIDNDGDGRIDEDGNLANCLTHGFTAVTCPFNQDHDAQVDEDGPNDDMDGTGREDGLAGADNCSDGIDNDGDGKVDGFDPQCLQRVNEDGQNEDGDGSEAGGRFPTNCADGIDNDGDGKIDDADPECAPYIDEDGGQDNDGDGRVDEDGRDDDRDGLTDEDGPLPCLVDRLNPLAGSQPCGIGAYRVRITYDPSVVQFRGITNGPFLTSNNRKLEVCYQTVGAGWVEFSCVTSERKSTPSTWIGPQGTGVLAEVSFWALTLGDSALDLTGSELLDVQGRPLNLTLTAGTASVVRCADVTLDGLVDFDDVLAVLAKFGATLGDPGWNGSWDFVVDSVLDFDDVLFALDEFGQICTFVP